VPINCNRRFSFDQSVLYIGVRDSQSAGYLVGLDSTTLTPLYRVRVRIPTRDSTRAWRTMGRRVPCVGPDGDVYFGVLENPSCSNDCRGWMLHFNSTLTTTLTPGAFGWDHTPSIVLAVDQRTS